MGKKQERKTICFSLLSGFIINQLDYALNNARKKL